MFLIFIENYQLNNIFILKVVVLSIKQSNFKLLFYYFLQVGILLLIRNELATLKDWNSL